MNKPGGYLAVDIPINRLPPEILTRIFRLIVDAQNCICIHSVIIRFPKYPDLLTHICPHWRHIALSSPTLWGHIDLAPCNPLHLGLLDRAAVYAARAENLPLSIHVMAFEPLGQFDNTIKGGLEQFLISVAPRIRALEFLVRGTLPVNDISCSFRILNTCFKPCIPGTLTRLTINNTSETFLTLLRSREPNFDHDEAGLVSEVYLDQSREFLDSLWQGITVLRLYGQYPHWKSPAYHGLTELRLTFGEDREIPLSEQQVIAMLGSSPKLRIFQLDNPPRDPLPLNATIMPVLLDELEVLDLAFMSVDDLRSLLRWIVPGAKPLQLSLTRFCHQYTIIDLVQPANEIEGFFSRSLVGSLRLVNIELSGSGLVNFLNLMTNPRTLVLETALWCKAAATQSPELYKLHFDVGKAPTTDLGLHQLYLLDYRIHLDSLKQFLRNHPVQRLTVWRPDFVTEPPSEGRTRDPGKELRACCGDVHFLGGSWPRPCPVGGWN